MLRLFAPLIDLVVPPRPGERVVRSLTLRQLQALDDGNSLPYRDPRVTALVWELKYYANRRAAGLAGALLAEKVLSCAAEELGVPLLLPVPMHAARRRERGHNQTELLCKATLKHLGEGGVLRKKVWLSRLRRRPEDFLEGDAADAVEYAPHALVRVRATPTQQGLERGKRLKNVKNSMEARRDMVEGRACIVLDDVITTGATLEEAERALRRAGARAVHTIALARS